ncbi:MAG: hypothetical protein ABR992_15545 [Solirubrobacteraceae bacterium]
MTELSRLAKNEIVEAIKGSTLSLAEFSREDGETVYVRHRATGSVLEINDYYSSDKQDWTYWITWRAGTDPLDSEITDRLEGPTVGWLDDIAAYMHAPDLWSELQQDSMVSSLLEGQDNRLFDEREREQIAAWAAGLKLEAKDTWNLPRGQLKLLEAKLDYLVEASRHARRIDWLNIAVGAVGGAFARRNPDTEHRAQDALGSRGESRCLVRPPGAVARTVGGTTTGRQPNATTASAALHADPVRGS